MEEAAMEKQTRDRNKEDLAKDEPEGRKGEKEQAETSWADEAAKARTAGDPRARTPSDATGQPSTRSFDE
jgi:hypothetical protein